MEKWREAFAHQAASDLDVYELLSRSAVPMAQRLHYLQMWLEKLCKAFLWSQADQFEMKHQVVAHVLPGLIANYWHRFDFKKAPRMSAFREYAAKSIFCLLRLMKAAGGPKTSNIHG